MNVAKKIACSTIYFLNKKQKREFKKTEKCFSAPAEKNVFFILLPASEDKQVLVLQFADRDQLIILFVCRV